MSGEENLARDGKRGCPVTVWDGPYSTRCGAGADTGRCAHHGPFAAPAANPKAKSERDAAYARGRNDALTEVQRLISVTEQVAGRGRAILTPDQIERLRHTEEAP